MLLVPCVDMTIRSAAIASASATSFSGGSPPRTCSVRGASAGRHGARHLAEQLARLLVGVVDDHPVLDLLRLVDRIEWILDHVREVQRAAGLLRQPCRVRRRAVAVLGEIDRKQNVLVALERLRHARL